MAGAAQVMMSKPNAPLLLIGAGGMLGRAWRELLASNQVAFVAPTRAQLDITNQAHIAAFITPQTTAVINCAAWTDVDAAESDEQGAAVLNAQAPALLAVRCKEVNTTLVHYSTDYVFNGQATSPYAIDQPREPLGAYGRTKAQGEVAIEKSGCKHLIIRTSWLYTPWGKNFVRTIAKLSQTKDTLSVVNDQVGRPTSAQYLAQASFDLIDKNAQGIFHVTDSQQCSWYDFAREIVAIAKTSCDVRPCSTDQFPRPAKRPAYSVLDLTTTQQTLGDIPTWQQNLAQVMRDMEPLS